MPPETIPVSLAVGSEYRFAGIHGPMRDGEPTWIFAPCRYRLLAVARNYRTGQDMVVYVGVGGWDEDNTYCCCLEDWQRCFTLIETEEPAAEAVAAEEPIPDRRAGFKSVEGLRVRGVIE